jgi:hypothetical protein
MYYDRAAAPSAEVAQAFIQKVYGWMSAGLILTGIIAYAIGASEAATAYVKANMPMVMILMIVEVVLVVYLSARIEKMSANIASFIFIAYAALNGVTLSIVFMIYTKGSIGLTFFVCSGMFAACSFYGWLTKKDLTSLGAFFFMGLIGLILALVANMFLQSALIDWAISCVGVVVFVGLTAYDTQKIKEMAATVPSGMDGDAVTRGAIIGALQLYLDFVNLMLHLLRFLGVKKD